jgi:tetratricopeptide (TPR) repeat protein
LNLGDTEGALRHYRLALEIAERLAAADQLDVRSRDDLQTSYRKLAAMLVEAQPAVALDYYEKAFAIVQTLREANIASVSLRRDLAASRLAIGEALHRMGKRDEALEHMTRAVEIMREIVAQVPTQVFWMETLARAHSDIGAVLLDRRDHTGALENLMQGLAATEKLVQDAPSSLHFARDRADAYESLGRYYSTLATRSTPNRSELIAQARSWFHKSQAVWQEWTRRKVAMPYAIDRESRVSNILKNLQQP